MMYYKQKDKFKIRKAKSLIIKNDTDYRDLAKTFSQGNTYIIFKENINGKITEILTEKEIVDKINLSSINYSLLNLDSIFYIIW